jgi:hypothetical protein
MEKTSSRVRYLCEQDFLVRNGLLMLKHAHDTFLCGMEFNPGCWVHKGLIAEEPAYITSQSSMATAIEQN